MKNIFTLASLALCLIMSTAVKAQTFSIFFLADNIRTGTSTVPSSLSNLTDVSSMGGGIACGGCAVSPVGTGAGSGKAQAAKIVLNFQKNDQVILALKTALLKGTTNGNAYLIFSKSVGTGRLATAQTDYYYIKLTNYTVMEIDETADKESSTVQVSLGYSGINWTFKPQLTTGALGTPVSDGWDFLRNVESTASAVPPTSLGSF